MKSKYLEKLIILNPELDTDDMRQYISLKKELEHYEKFRNTPEINKIKKLFKSKEMKYCARFDTKLIEKNIKFAIKLEAFE